ncbi:MAG: signal peptidase I [Promethearchaeota archaeon]|nr:MAG: signal peptidase I [Candidatus Lokiarchaeota archaeon]
MENKRLKKKDKEDREKPSTKKIIIAVFLIGFAFFGSFLIYFILQVALNTPTPMVVVVSGSMEPELYKGDLLFLQGVEPEDLRDGTIEDKDGDIIVYDARGLWDGAPDEPIVHRIIDKWHNESGWWFKTKGDANSMIDGERDVEGGVPIPEDRIFGKVVGKIPYIGWVKIFLTETNLLIPLIVILAVPLIVSIIMDIFKEEDEEEAERKKESKKPSYKVLKDPDFQKSRIKDEESQQDQSTKDDFDF